MSDEADKKALWRTRDEEGRWVSGYSTEMALRICTELATGRSLASVCREPWAPPLRSMWEWMLRHPEFRAIYERAKMEAADALFEEILDIADDGTNDWVKSADPENPGYKFNGEHFQRSRLRVDTRKWMVAKMKPKKYGDRLELAGGFEVRRAAELSDDELARIAAGGSAGAADAPSGEAESSSVH